MDSNQQQRADFAFATRPELRFLSLLSFVLLALPGSTAAAEPSDCPQGAMTSISGYRVVIDPADLDTDSAGLAAQLRSQGFSDLFTVKTGEQSGYTAVGFFGEESNANTRVAKLRELGFEAEAVPLSTTLPTACPETDQPPVSMAGPGKEPGSEQATVDTVAPPAPEAAVEPSLPVEAAEPATPASGCEQSGASYLVLADPADNGGDTLALVYQLRGQGIEELFVVNAEPNKGQVSLGIFNNAEDAQERVQQLSAMGFQVRSQRLDGGVGSDCSS